MSYNSQNYAWKINPQNYGGTLGSGLHAIFVTRLLPHTVPDRIAGKFGGGRFGKLTLFEPLARESWRINRSANRLLIVSTNLDGFNLVNHGRFAKLSRYTVYIFHTTTGGSALSNTYKTKNGKTQKSNPA